MPFSNQRRLPNNSRSHSRSRTTTTTRQILPKAIRDELRMCCALRGYSSIREGDGKTIKQQHDLISDFFHGVTGKSPSQIRMLCEGKLHYGDLYESSLQRNLTSRKKKTTTTKIYLKENLSRDDSRVFYLGTDIFFNDLQKKNRSGDTLLNGRQLIDMAKRGLRDYRKAMAFTTDKWNIKTNEPIESGTTVDDVIEYVRRRMYLSSNIISIDDEDDNEAESEIMIELNKKKKGKTTKVNNVVDKTVLDSNDSDSSIDDVDDLKKANNKKVVVVDKSTKDVSDIDDEENGKGITRKNVDKRKRKGNGEDNCDDNDSNEDVLNSDEESSSDNSTYVPDTYFFHSFFAYCLWGPFAKMDKQLPLFLLGKLLLHI